MLRLKSLLIENAGAIENLNIQFPFTADNLPKPLILVGENGSGKTTALSFIADSLLQGVSTKFDDVLVPKGFGTLFYRLRSLDVRIGATSSITHICYEHRGQNLHYVDRIGDGADVAAIRQRLGLPPDLPLSAAEPIEKVWTPNIQQVAATVGEGAYVFFPSGRREIPHWMQETALHRERYSTKQRFGNSLNKSLIVETAAEENTAEVVTRLHP